MNIRNKYKLLNKINHNKNWENKKRLYDYEKKLASRDMSLELKCNIHFMILYDVEIWTMNNTAATR